MKKQLAGFIFLSLASPAFSQQQVDQANMRTVLDPHISDQTLYHLRPDEDSLTVTGVMYLASPVVRSIADRLSVNEQVEMVGQMVDEFRQHPHNKRDSLALANIWQTVEMLEQQSLSAIDKYGITYQETENTGSLKRLSEIFLTYPFWSVLLLFACLLGIIQIAGAVAGFCSGVVSRLWSQIQSERQLLNNTNKSNIK